MSKRGKRRRGKRPRSRSRQHDGSPGWHLKLEEFRREARAKAPEILVREMKGWELHLSYKPEHHQCSVCKWSGESDAACPDCGNTVRAEPWSLAAKPHREHNDYTWLGRAAEFLGAPAEDKPEKPPKGEKRVVMFFWADRVAVNPLEGA